MENIKGALLHDVHAARELLKCHEAMEYCGYQDNPFWDNYAIIADSIYTLIGEHTENFGESVTYLALSAPYLSDERRVEMLYAEYKKNFPSQPKPITSETDGENKAGYKCYNISAANIT